MKQFFILLSGLLISTACFAAKDPVVIPSEESNQVVEDSSAFHRVGKKFMFGAQILGVGPAYSTSTGVRAGYFIDRNMVVEAEIMFGEQEGDGTIFGTSSLFDYGSYDIEGRSIGIHFKHFVGNSFYYRAGIDYRWVDYKYTYDNSGSVAAGAFKGTSGAITFNIGNQWQWANFNLGCDWVGVTSPFVTNISGEQFASNTVVYDADDFEDDKKSLVKKLNLNLVRFYLGASF